MKKIAIFIFLLVVAWSVMVVVHECGHIVCGWLAGGQLAEADIAPWHLPHSRFDPDPSPLLTLWGGPILGAVVPVALAFLFGLIFRRRQQWAWFIANFCLLANGCYLALSWYTGEQNLDTPKLLSKGAAPILIAIYCLLAIGFGYVGFRKSCMYFLDKDRV